MTDAGPEPAHDEHGDVTPVADSSEQSPLVSVGLAVYNGERYLAEAIDSILAQTFTDFELIISDNASTDATAEICRERARRDRRIRYSRNPVNIGGARNENLTVTLARGRYFRWAAHDDYLEPTLLERCVDVLERQPEVVICYTQVREIDSDSNTLQIISRNNADSPSAAMRFGRIILSGDFLEETYGLMRVDVLRTTRLQADYTASDRTLMAELSLHGRFHEVPEVLFAKRLHDKNVYVDWRTRLAWFAPDRAGAITFPWWAQWQDLWSTVARVDVAPATKLRCAGMVAVWTVVRAPKLAKDVAVALVMLVRGKQWRLRRYAATQNWE